MKNSKKMLVVMSMLSACLATAHHAACASPQDRWMQFGSTNEMVAYMDMQSAKFDKVGGQAWVRWDHSRPQSTAAAYPAKFYQSVLILMHFNCSDQTSSSSQDVLYADPHAAGEVVWTDSFKDWQTSFTALPPGSIGETTISIFCQAREAKWRAPRS